ncbi:hypothetical protein HPB50_004469 [Hyalomma asiaticum]|uniref:Uncharacterized protein n=1 Tax=Hyalomma asiaticum TaxID=266040 RepID=A0ACB7S2R8_HYAAI|nr:hypothetical protein HPB50_004469 [Hyalomma asiaticum]
MLRHARQCCREHDVCFEHHDIEYDNPNLILDKYGPFDRVFAFLTFHFVWNLKTGYENVNRLLKDGGECLTVNFTRTGITDVLYRLHQKGEWRAFVPDLTAIFADRFCFDRPVPKKQLIGLEKSAVTDAGLHLISCNTYKSQWIFPNMEECSDLYVPLFKLGDNVPKEKQSDFLDAFKSTVLEVSGTAKHITFDYDSIVTHSQKRRCVSC